MIEPRLSLQWFLSMEELSKPALDAVMNTPFNFTRPSSRTATATGWRTSRIGASAANCSCSNSRLVLR